MEIRFGTSAFNENQAVIDHIKQILDSDVSWKSWRRKYHPMSLLSASKALFAF